jgi:hypothetical protein
MSNARCSACISTAKYYKNHENLKEYFKLRARKERLENPEKVRIRERRRNRSEEGLKRRYGLTKETYNAILTAQHGVCKLCSGKQELGQSRNLYVDHDHVTGKIRGLLCGHCNAGLGQFKDNIETLKKAIEYLIG